MNILITGGAGYLGYSLTAALDRIDAVNTITIYDNLYRNNLNFFTQGDKFSKVKFIKGDILNEYMLQQACIGQDVVIHLAAHVDFPYSYKDNYIYEQTNQFGTGVLSNVLRENPPQKLIYASSGAIYGFQDNANEDSLPMPENAYGKSKFEGEKYIKLLQDKCDVSILRIGNVFGYNPMFRYDAVINHFIFNALLYNKIQILGSGNQERPFVHISHLIEYISKLILDETNANLINIVQDSMSMNYVLEILLKLQPELEFNYVNSHQEFKGYTMTSKYLKIDKDLEECVNATYYRFKENFKITNALT